MRFKSALNRCASNNFKVPEQGAIRCISLGLQGEDLKLSSDEALNQLLKKSLEGGNWKVQLKTQHIIHFCIPQLSRRMNKKLSEEKLSSVYGTSDEAYIYMGLIDDYNLLIKSISAYYSRETATIFEENLEEAVKNYTVNKLTVEAKYLIHILSCLEKCTSQCIHIHNNTKKSNFAVFLMEYFLKDTKDVYHLAKLVLDQLSDEFFNIDDDIVSYVAKIFQQFLDLTDSLRAIYQQPAMEICGRYVEPPCFDNKVEHLRNRMWKHEAEVECQQACMGPNPPRHSNGDSVEEK